MDQDFYVSCGKFEINDTLVTKQKSKEMTCKIRIFWLTVFCLIGMVAQTQAQRDTTRAHVFGAFLLLSIEFPVVDHSAFDQQLNKNGFPSANFPTANAGIGFQLYTNRLISTLSFNIGTKKDDQETYLTEVEYRSFSFNFGYDLTKSQWYSIYPYAGLKGSGLNYLYREKMADESSMDNYLKTKLEYKEVTNSRAHLDLGIGVSHQWFYLVNFRFGYLLPVEKIRWNIDNNQTNLAASPGISYKYYFTLTLGLGNIASDKDIR